METGLLSSTSDSKQSERFLWDRPGPRCATVRRTVQCGKPLFDLPCSRGVNEIGIGGCLAASPHLAGDLPAMIRGMHYDVGQNVLHVADQGLASAVFVVDFLRQPRSSELFEKFPPFLFQVCDLHFALFETGIRPYGHALRLAENSFKPEPLCRENVRQ